MQRALFIGVGVALVLGAIAVFAVALWPRGRTEPVEVAFEDLDLSLRAVRVRGTAHYRGLVTQKSRGGLPGQPDVAYVYALFPVHDLQSREVRVLVRTTEPPPKRIDFGFVEVEGWIDPPRAHTVPMGTEQMMARADYFFHPDLVVIDAWEVRGFDPTRQTSPDEAPSGEEQAPLPEGERPAEEAER